MKPPGGMLARLSSMAILALALSVVHSFATGHCPIVHDHPVHVFKAWCFWTEDLMHGRLRGWTSRWFFGYPNEELYPVGPDLWVALFRVLTLGLLRWDQTYAIAFAAAFVLTVWSVFALGRRMLGTTAGFVGAVIYALDQGFIREGGWTYTVNFGVWAQPLGMAFFLLAIEGLDAALSRGTPFDRVRVAVFLAASVITHPVHLMVAAIVVPIFVLPRIRTWRELVALIEVHLRATALAAFWLVPMISRRAWTNDIGHRGRSLVDMALDLVSGDLFLGGWWWLVPAMLVGSAAVARRRSAVGAMETNPTPQPWRLALAGVALLIASSSSFILTLESLTGLHALERLQYERLIVPAKALLFPMAGAGLVAIPELAKAALRRVPHLGQVAWFAGAALSTTLLCASALPSWLRLTGPATQALSAEPRPSWNHDYANFLAWAALSHADRVHEGHFHRFAFLDAMHSHLFMAAPVTTGLSLYKVGYTPAKLFIHAPENMSPALFSALSVDRIVTPDPYFTAPWAIPERTFGSIRVFRFAGYRPERYTLLGSGDVQVLDWTDEHVRLRLQGVSPGAWIVLHVAAYPRWHIRIDGRSVPMSVVPVPGTSGPPMLMSVPIRNGVLTLDDEALAVDRIGAGLSLAALAWLLAQWVSFRRARARS